MDMIPLLMFPALLVALFLGFHVAFAMMSVALIFGLFTFGAAVIFQFVENTHSVATNFTLAAVPLFIFMGAMLERAGIAEKLFDALNLWTRRLPGGLALSTILLSVVFAATAGVVGATEAVIGMLAIPAMLRHGYDKRLISGTICAGGSLGTVIPPSLTVVILGPVADVSVGKLFAGMLVPGLCMALCYVAYLVFVAVKNPERVPVAKTGSDIPLAKRLRLTLFALLPPLILIFAVLGTIFTGIAAPTEAAAMGALAAAILAACHGQLSATAVKEALLKTVQITAMILLIIVGGSMFAGVFAGSGGLMLMQDLLGGGDMNRYVVLGLVLTVTFFAGFMLDWISIMLLVIPVAIPVITGLGFDPVWFCVLFLIVIQTSYLTPPLAPAIFYLKGIAPPEIELRDMFYGVIPFIALHFVILALVFFAPALVTAPAAILLR